MTSPSMRRSRRAVAAFALLTLALVPGLTQLPAVADDTSGADPATVGATTPVGGIADPVAGLLDVDVRGTTLPSPAQRRAAARLGAVELRWNDFGTPSSILPADGALARATSASAPIAARRWLSDNADLFGLTRSGVAALELVNDQRLAMGGGHAVLFRQRFGDLRAALGSMVTVGVANGEIAYASSSITKTTGHPPVSELSPCRAGCAPPITSACTCASPTSPGLRPR